MADEQVSMDRKVGPAPILQALDRKMGDRKMGKRRGNFNHGWDRMDTDEKRERCGRLGVLLMSEDSGFEEDSAMAGPSACKFAVASPVAGRSHKSAHLCLSPPGRYSASGRNVAWVPAVADNAHRSSTASKPPRMKGP